MSATLSGLGRRLVRDGVLTAEAAAEALAMAKRERMSFTVYLVEKGVVDGLVIAKLAAEEFGSPIFDLRAYDKNVFDVKELVAIDLIQKHHALPLFKRGTRLYVGISDPADLHALDEIRFNTGLNTEAVVVEVSALSQAIKKLVEGTEDSVGTGLDDLGDDSLEDLDIEAVDDDAKGDVNVNEADETPVVRFINKVLVDAIRTGASDLHFEPYEKSYRVRYRTDGILHEVARPPVQMAPRLAARLKVMSQMDISERRVPQDGRMKMKLSKTKSIDFRVNTLPTLWGEKICARILDPSSAQLGIDALGYEPDQKQLYLDALQRPQGMIIVTGPTGSGKTVSLYTGLNILNTPEVNISTAEDPVEINLEGINQVNVNPKQGLGFAEALKSFLRQDPDVIMVGEIRDLETGSIAVKAAQTGHMVMSTMHTNSAAETITRMINMGIPPFNIATSLELIIAQRLGRRLCSACKQPVEYPQAALLEEGFLESDLVDVQLFKAVGCSKCNNGYKGRVGIYEVVKVTDSISRIIMENGNSIQIDDACRAEGFNSLRRSALMKVLQGVTTLEEANRVT